MTTALLKEFTGQFSSSPQEFFHQLFVPNINREKTEDILSRSKEGSFILREASSCPYDMPEGMTRCLCVSYYNTFSNRFNHLILCTEESLLYWSVLIDVNEFQSYPSLKDILYDIPFIRNTGMKHVLVLQK